MNTRYKIALAMLAGIGLGAAAIQGLHAQAKPPAYVIIPILKIADADTFQKIGPIAGPAAAAAGGHYIIRTDKTIKLDGTPPARLVVIAFDSVEKAQAWANSAAIKQVDELRAKSTQSLSFIVEGVAK
jgi:uncharacterized protein (DUF1330 family)